MTHANHLSLYTNKRRYGSTRISYEYQCRARVSHCWVSDMQVHSKGAEHNGYMSNSGTGSKSRVMILPIFFSV